MGLLSILAGLIGLSVVIFVHELGHFAFARMAGVEVEELSLGWGPKLFAFKKGRTSYRISALPIGGYCRMKGEDSYRKAIEQNLADFPREPGDYFACPPLKRILISVGGPLFNLIFAFLVFIAINAAGYTVQTSGNRIILASDIEPAAIASAAQNAGMKTGDAITSIDGTRIQWFDQIIDAVSSSADKTLAVTVQREGKTIGFSLKPVLDKKSASGRLGVYSWIDPVIRSIDKDSPAFLCGFREGDRIVSVNGTAVKNTVEFDHYVSKSKPARLEIEYLRNGTPYSATLLPDYSPKAAPYQGIGWQLEEHTIVSKNILAAVPDGYRETMKTVSGTFRGIASLFKGVDLFSALSGPARITWAVGQVTTNGFETGIQNGFSYLFSFLAVLSIGLFIMNLLPIPILDGGWIVLFFLELVRGKPAKVKTVFRYQILGIATVAALFLLTTVGDILFFSGK